MFNFMMCSLWNKSYIRVSSLVLCMIASTGIAASPLGNSEWAGAGYLDRNAYEGRLRGDVDVVLGIPSAYFPGETVIFGSPPISSDKFGLGNHKMLLTDIEDSIWDLEQRYDDLDVEIQLRSPIESKSCEVALKQLETSYDGIKVVNCLGDTALHLAESHAYGSGRVCRIENNLTICKSVSVTLTPTTDALSSNNLGNVQYSVNVVTSEESRHKDPTVQNAFIPIQVGDITTMIPAAINVWENFVPYGSPSQMTADSLTLTPANTAREIGIGCAGYKILKKSILNVGSVETIAGTEEKKLTTSIRLPGGISSFAEHCPGSVASLYLNNVEGSQLSIAFEASIEGKTKVDVVHEYTSSIKEDLVEKNGSFSTLCEAGKVFSSADSGIQNLMEEISNSIRADMAYYAPIYKDKTNHDLKYENLFNSDNSASYPNVYRPSLSLSESPNWVSPMFYDDVGTSQIGFEGYYPDNAGKINMLSLLYVTINGPFDPNTNPFYFLVASSLDDLQNQINKTQYVLDALNSPGWSSDAMVLQLGEENQNVSDKVTTSVCQ